MNIPSVTSDASVNNNNYPLEFFEFAEGLYAAENFDKAFKVFETFIRKLGFDGVLYTYIPQVIVDSKFAISPVYEVSEDYCPAYVNHYTEARFDKVDPLIDAVRGGVKEPIDWWGDVCASYIDQNPNSEQVLATAGHYGIKNGLTLPLMKEVRGLAGASFICSEERHYDLMLEERIHILKISARLFHNMVVSNACYMGNFARPLLKSLSETERQLIIGMAGGHTTKALSVNLNRSNKYLEQVMINVRRKLSGVKGQETATVNRNQLLYYAGLLSILDQQ